MDANAQSTRTRGVAVFARRDVDRAWCQLRVIFRQHHEGRTAYFDERGEREASQSPVGKVRI